MALNAGLHRGRFALRADSSVSPGVRGGRRAGYIATGVCMALAAVVLPVPLAVAALGAVAIGTLLLARPEVTLYLLVFSVPYESLHEVQVGGLNATITEYIAFCGGAAYLMRCALDGRMNLRWASWRWALLLFAAAMIASMSQASDLKLSIKELLKLGEMLLTYLLVVKYVNSPDRLRRLLLLVVLAAGSQALLGIGQAAAHFGPASFARGALLRGSGTFDQPNPFAGYLNLTLPILFAGVVAGVPLVGTLTGPALVLLSAGVFLSVSRGALLASLVAAAVILAVRIRPSRQFLVAGGVFFAALMAGSVVGLVPAAVTDQVTGALGLSNVDIANPTPVTWPIAERLAHMLAGLHMFADHPWLGVGIGNYAAAYPKYQVAPVWINPLGHAHNYYINISAEAGVLGLAAFLIVLVSAFVIVGRSYRRASDPAAKVLALGVLGVLATVAVHSFFDNIFVHAMEAQLALVVGLATVACRMRLGDGPQEVW